MENEKNTLYLQMILAEFMGCQFSTKGSFDETNRSMTKIVQLAILYSYLWLESMFLVGWSHCVYCIRLVIYSPGQLSHLRQAVSLC